MDAASQTEKQVCVMTVSQDDNIDGQSETREDEIKQITRNLYSSIDSAVFDAAISSFSDAVRNLIPKDAIDSLASSISKIYAPMNLISETLANFQKLFAETFKPLTESIRRFYDNADWEKLAEGSKRWGEYGWIPPEGLSLAQIANPPETLLEADGVALACIGEPELEELFEFLLQIVPKRKDMQEAIRLFQEKRYKPTAMMLCSLIECELIKADDRDRWRDPRHVIRRVTEELPESGMAVISLPALSFAYNYFFKSAANFNRETEGELNRNMLQHGMMYKPVRKKTCIKLFLLLQEVAVITRF